MRIGIVRGKFDRGFNHSRPVGDTGGGANGSARVLAAYGSGLTLRGINDGGKVDGDCDGAGDAGYVGEGFGGEVNAGEKRGGENLANIKSSSGLLAGEKRSDVLNGGNTSAGGTLSVDAHGGGRRSGGLLAGEKGEDVMQGSKMIAGGTEGVNAHCGGRRGGGRYCEQQNAVALEAAGQTRQPILQRAKELLAAASAVVSKKVWRELVVVRDTTGTTMRDQPVKQDRVASQWRNVASDATNGSENFPLRENLARTNITMKQDDSITGDPTTSEITSATGSASKVGSGSPKTSYNDINNELVGIGNPPVKKNVACVKGTNLRPMMTASNNTDALNGATNHAGVDNHAVRSCGTLRELVGQVAAKMVATANLARLFGKNCELATPATTIEVTQRASVDTNDKSAAAKNQTKIPLDSNGEIRCNLTKKVSNLKGSGHVTTNSLEQHPHELEGGSPAEYIATLFDNTKSPQRDKESPLQATLARIYSASCSQ